MWHGVLIWLGITNASGRAYLAWSGSGSVLLPPLLTLAGVALLFWWHHQCGVHGCFWYARRTTAAGDRVCFRHHPRPERTVQDIHDAHHAALRHPGREAGG